MPTVNETLQDRAISHAIDLHRYGNTAVLAAIKALNAGDARLAAAIGAALEQVGAGTGSFVSIDALQRSFQPVIRINAASVADAVATLPPAMQGLAAHEVAWQAASLVSAIPDIIVATLPVVAASGPAAAAAALATPFQGRLLSGWAANLEASRLLAVENAVRQGFVEGRTTDQIVRAVRGTRAAAYADGALNRSRSDVAAVVQTALSHTAAVARQATYDANADLIAKVSWLATLDTKTSAICRARDGLQYSADANHTPVGHKLPWLGGPGNAHFNCRSVAVPVTKSWRELGFNIDEMTPGTRASMDGQVPAETNYADWFAKQSAARQDEILGPTRGKLYRQGKIPLDKFTNDRGRTLTLAELNSRT